MHLLKEDLSNKVVDEDTELDDILIQASQLYEALTSMRVERQGDVETGDEVSPAIVEHRFSSLSGLRKLGFFWATQQLEKLSAEEMQSWHKLEVTMVSMSVSALNYWLGRFFW